MWLKMTCYFQIQLPGGEFIWIPSSVNIIDSQEDSFAYYTNTGEDQESWVDPTDFHKKYKEWLNTKASERDPDFMEIYDEQIQRLSDFSSNLISYYNLSINPDKLQSIIMDSTADDYVKKINDFIQESVTQDSFERSLRSWIYNENRRSGPKNPKNVTPTKLDEFIKYTSKKVTPKYFEELGFMNIVGKSSIKDEIDNISDTIGRLENEFGLSAAIQKDIRRVLRTLSSSDMFDSKILYGITSTGSENDTLVLPKSDLSNGFIFYNKGNSLSLFLAVFKYLSSLGTWDGTLSDETYKKLGWDKNTVGIKTYEDALKDVLKSWNGTVPKKKSEENSDKSEIVEFRNFSPIKFFTGEFKGGKFKDAMFHRLFNNFSLNHMEQIIDILVETLDISNKSKVASSMKKSIKYINPKKYGTDIFTSQYQGISEYDSQSIRNQQLKYELIARKYGALAQSKERDYHYSYLMTIYASGENIQSGYLEALNKIELGKDLIKVKNDNRKKYNYNTDELYVIPLKISLRKSKLVVIGLTMEDGKEKVAEYEIPIKVKKGFKKSLSEAIDIEKEITIEYKKFVSDTKPVYIPIPSKLENASFIKSKDDSTPLSPEIVKNYIQVGSIITYLNSKGVKQPQSVVTSVLPGKIQVKAGGRSYMINYNSILKINTTKLTREDKTDWKETDFDSTLAVSGISARILPTSGDIVKFNENDKIRINKVLDSDESSVYVIVNETDKDGKFTGDSYVDKIPRTQITNAFINFERISADAEIDTVLSEYNNIQLDKSIRNHKYSYTQDINEASDGDIIVVQFGEEIALMKLLDKKTMKVVERLGVDSKDYKVQILSKESPIIGVFTTRDISENYALDIARVNERKIFVNEEEGSEVVYLAPNNMNLENALLFDSLHFNIGLVVEKWYYENNLDKYQAYTNVTPLALKLISRKLNKSVTSLKFQSINTERYENIHKRHVDDLIEIFRFDELDKNDKKEHLQEGAYFRLKSNSNERKIYRLSKDLDTNALIEYSILSPFGEIKTIRKIVSKDELVDSINQFYLIKGNSKIQPILRKISLLKSEEKKEIRTKEEVRESFVFTVSKGLEPFGIKVEQLSEKEGNFENGQKAKIQGGKIIINKDNSSAEDVVHEFLHVFLIGLKYTNSEAYSNLLLSFWNERSKLGETFFSAYNINPEEITTLDHIEEVFVRAVSKMMMNSEDIDFNTLDNIEEGIKLAISSLGLTIGKYNSKDIYGILTKPIRKIVEPNKLNKNEIFSNYNLLTYDANFREWIETEITNNRLKIKCN